MKGVLMGWTNIEPKSIQALNETTFLATYAVSILAEEIGTAIEKINNWLRNQWLLLVMRLLWHNSLMCLNMCDVHLE